MFVYMRESCGCGKERGGSHIRRFVSLLDAYWALEKSVYTVCIRVCAISRIRPAFDTLPAATCLPSREARGRAHRQGSLDRPALGCTPYYHLPDETPPTAIRQDTPRERVGTRENEEEERGFPRCDAFPLFSSPPPRPS